MTKREAQREAKRLCAVLGPGWKPRVWHNLEWCYSVSFRNYVHVHPADGQFFCMIGEGSCMLAMFAPGVRNLYDRDPVRVVQKALRAYRASFEQFAEEHRIMLNNADVCLKAWEPADG